MPAWNHLFPQSFFAKPGRPLLRTLLSCVRSKAERASRPRRIRFMSLSR
jgi:hypothetical protein